VTRVERVRVKGLVQFVMKIVDVQARHLTHNNLLKGLLKITFDGDG